MTPPAAATPAAPAQNPAAQPPAATGTKKPLAMDECGLKTKYPGDEYCIKPPAADKGFQLHIGPTNYDNPEAKYLLQPGEENVTNMTATSGNDKDVDYYWRQYRMRPGSHHVILTANGQRIGGTQNLARDNPDNGIVPPENEGVGLPLAAHAQINANMHFYNFTDKPMVRDLWVNYWYKDKATVTDTAKGVFSMTGVSAAKAHTHVVVGATCQVQGSGRILSMSGHRHLNNVRFSAWLNSGGKKTLIFDDYDSEHPGYMEFNSLVQNPAPNPTAKLMGGASGIVNIKQGDTLDFECEIVNNTDKNFVGLNEAQDDEMCILTGDTVGASVSAGCSPIASRPVTGGAAD
ncbi:MAG TPA: hypothetical protein VJV78_02790 [Polyangiales bacterium]|nr:hypothetical protein [Polyangiales bacterium]